MSLTRVTRTLAVAAFAGVLVGTTYGADAAGRPAPSVRPAHAVRSAAHHQVHDTVTNRMVLVHGKLIHCGLDMPD